MSDLEIFQVGSIANQITSTRENPQRYRVYLDKGVCPTLNCAQGGGRQPCIIVFRKVIEMFKIRRLMPEECFVLMGLTIEDCKKCREVGISDTQLYKQAGNGLVTNIVQYIAEHAYKVTHKDYICTDEQMIKDGFGI